MPGDWLDDVLQDWRVFDTGAFQLRLNALRQQRAEVEGQKLHVLHVEGRGPSPLPLLLTHGWPGSFAPEARRLLAHTDRPVTTIARELGFDDPSNFAAFFTQQTDETPTRFRRRTGG